MYLNWIWGVLSLIVAAVLIYFVVQGVLFVGWAIGGVLGVLLVALLVLGVLEASWVLGLIVLIIVLNLLFNFI